MVRQKLLSFLFSAVLIALVAATTMRMVATHARTTLDERLPVLALAGQTVASQFVSANHDLSTLANQIARDDGLANELRVLDGFLAVLTTSRSPGERLKKQAADQSVLVAQRVEAARTQAFKESTSLALLDDQGRVQVSDDPALPQGARFSALVPPPPPPPRVEATDDDDLETPPPAPAPVAPPVLINEAFNDTLRAGFDNKDAFVLRSDEGALLHVASAPIVAKDKVVGVVVLERPLPKAKPIPHIATATLLDGKVKSGTVPEGVDLKGIGPQQLPRKVSFTLPVLGGVAMQPLFVDPQAVGVWAQRFDIPGLPGMSGFAYTDFSSAFADVARMQVIIGLLAIALALAIGVIIVFTGFPVMRGISRISDVISTNQQKGEQTRLQERSYPEALHRLVRLINKELEKGATAKSQTARNAKIEEVIPKKKSVTLVDVDALDFGDVAPATPRDPTASADNGLSPFAGNTGTGQFDLPPVSAPAPGQFNVQTGAMRGPGLAVPPAAIPKGSATPFAATTGQFKAPASGQINPSGQWSPPASAPAASAGFTQPMPSPFGTPSPGILAPVPENPRAAAMLSSLEDLSTTLMNETQANQKRLAEAAAANALQPPPRTAPASPPPRPSAPADPRTLIYREVYDKFVATRKQCGEAIDDLSFGPFAQRLIETREQMVKQGTKDVKFDVYVKNGKAALKVTPVP